jgi:pectate lyase
VLCDDFEDGNTTGWTVRSGTWSLASDGSSVYKQGSNVTPAESSVGSAAWADQTVEARVKVLQFGGTSSSYRVGVYARYQDSNNFYAVVLRGDGRLEVRKKSSTLATAIDVNAVVNTWYTLKIKVSGSAGNVTVQGFLNGVLQQTVTDSSTTVASGSAAVATFGGNTQAHFDDVRVSTP